MKLGYNKGMNYYFSELEELELEEIKDTDRYINFLGGLNARALAIELEYNEWQYRTCIPRLESYYANRVKLCKACLGLCD